MEILKVEIKRVDGDEVLKGYVRVVYDNGMVLSDIKVVDRGGKVFVSFPKERKRGRFYPIISFNDVLEKDRVCGLIMEEYGR